MFALSHGELAICVFIFLLVWGAGVLPKVGERVSVWLARKGSADSRPRPPEAG
jgi:Sec-independent protein translocase protein TatA